jgi:hypothetical protein
VLHWCHSEKAERDLHQAMLELSSGSGPHAADMAEAIDLTAITDDQRNKYSMWLFDEVLYYFIIIILLLYYLLLSLITHVE